MPKPFYDHELRPAEVFTMCGLVIIMIAALFGIAYSSVLIKQSIDNERKVEVDAYVSNEYLWNTTYRNEL